MRLFSAVPVLVFAFALSASAASPAAADSRKLTCTSASPSGKLQITIDLDEQHRTAIVNEGKNDLFGFDPVHPAVFDPTTVAFDVIEVDYAHYTLDRKTLDLSEYRSLGAPFEQASQKDRFVIRYTCQPFVPSSHDQAMDGVNRCAETSDPNQALAYCNAAIESGSLAGEERALAFYVRGAVYTKKSNDDRALQDYDESIRLNPLFSYAFNNRGFAYQSKGNYERAIQNYDQAIRLDSSQSGTFNSRAWAHFYLNQFDAAQADFATALKLRPDDPYAILWLYLSRSRAGQDARSELEKNATQLKLATWPGPLISLYLGKAAPEAILSAASDSDPKTDRAQQCRAYFYLGERALIEGKRIEAKRLFQLAIHTGITTTYEAAFYEYIGAQAELKRLPASQTN
jgi:lipoprotein NlpI